LSWLASVIVSHSLALRHSDWVQRWFPLKDSSHGQAHELLCSLFSKVVLWTLQSALQHHMLASELLSTSQQFSEPSIPFGPQYHPRGFLRLSSQASTVLKSLIQLGPLPMLSSPECRSSNQRRGRCRLSRVNINTMRSDSKTYMCSHAGPRNRPVYSSSPS
jgi:hypothetical protein